MNIDQFKELLRKVTQDSNSICLPDTLSKDTRLKELPLDSIHYVELSMEIETLVGSYIDTDLFFEDYTIGEILERI